MPRADLHAHTNVSDGTLTPTQLVERAAEAGLHTLAITDHDATGALAEAYAAGARLGVHIVPGIELSADGELHILGYFLDITNATLQARLTRLREAREERGGRIVAKLRALGVGITIADVEAEAGAADGRALGRPHVARALMRLGAVASVQEAFDRYLAEGRPAYVPKLRLAPEEAIALIHASGGAAVLAHPITIPEAHRERVVRELATMGLDGLETWHSKHAHEDVERFASWAKELHLVATGGSDFHGENKPTVALGSPRVGLDVVDALRERSRRRHAP